MTAWGQNRKSVTATGMSAFGGKADEIGTKADITALSLEMTRSRLSGEPIQLFPDTVPGLT